MIEAVVFDMDGVIVDSEPVWQQVRLDLVSERGGVWTTEDGDVCRGRPSSVWSTFLSERLNGAMSPEDVYREILGRMVRQYHRNVPVFPGALEAISRIASKYTVAVASGSPNVLIDTVLEETGLNSILAAVGYGDDVAEGKPAPDIYQNVLAQLDVQPRRALGVEDSHAGLISLEEAGMHSIAVVSAEYTLADDLVSRSDAQITTLADLTVSMVDAIGAAD